MNQPIESNATACLPPPPHRSSNSGSNTACCSEKIAETFESPQVSELRQQPPSAKKARLETTNNEDDEDYSVEYRRLNKVIMAHEDEQRTTGEEYKATWRAIRGIENPEESGNVEELERLTRLRDALGDKFPDLHKKDRDLSFDMLCLKVRHNQPLDRDTTLTDDNQAAFPEGYANRLGQALLQNTQVTALALFPRVMLPTDCGWDMRQALAYIDPMLRFVQTSQCLRHVKLLEAHGYDDDEQCFGCTPLETFNALLESILSAIVASPSIEGMNCECHESSSLLAFMSTAKKLKSLNIDLHLEDDLDTDEKRSLVQVWQATDVATTLERLTLQNIEHYPNMAVAILENLNIWAPALNELTLDGRFYDCTPELMSLHFWHGVATSLRSHSTPMLRTLQLVGLKFDAERMILLLDGLRNVDNSGQRSSVTIHKLSFSWCIWDQEAADALLKWMHTPTTNETSSNTAAGVADNTRHRGCCSSLRELHFDHVSNNTLGGSKPARTIASMLLLPKPSQIASSGSHGHTIGSQIHTLSLGRLDTTDGSPHLGVLSRLARSHERVVQLTVVRFEETDIYECRRLRQVIRKLPSIQEVHFGRLYLYNPFAVSFRRPDVLVMLRENVRLGTCSYDDESTTFFTMRQVRLIAAFQERNQFLCRHFGNESLEADFPVDNKKDETTTDMDESITTTSVHPQRLDASLYPPLFQVAEPILPSQQWHIPFRGLTMLGESIGGATGTSDESS